MWWDELRVHSLDVDARAHASKWRKGLPIGFATGKAKFELIPDMRRSPMERHRCIIAGHKLISIKVLCQVVFQNGLESLPCMLVDKRTGHFKSSKV